MGSSDPSLVPEWLRNNGHGNSGASGANHFASANSHSDASLLGNSARKSLFRTNTDIDNPRTLLERSSSFNSRSSSNNGSSKHPYSNFSRSHRDKERDKEKSDFGNFREHDGYEPLGKDSLRRTHLMAPRNQGDSLAFRMPSDSKNIESYSHPLRNGLVTRDKSVGILPKVSFEKDFPSLGADERQMPNVVRITSPGLPIGSSSLVGEGWSALAEVPVVTGSNNSSQTVHQHHSNSVDSSSNSGGSNAVSAASTTTPGTSNASSGPEKTSGGLGSSSGLNMAEALVQSPPVTRTAPHLSIETQRLEQMAVNKVRQLIPLTPAAHKVWNSSNKLKPKVNSRVREIIVATKFGKQLSSSSLNAVGQSPRSGIVTHDATSQSHCSKLSVLKPPWEHSVSSTSKDGSNPENGGADIRLSSNLHAIPAASSAHVKSTNITKASIVDHNTAVSSLSPASVIENRLSSSCARSRSDFFNSVRKKTLTTAATTETDIVVQSPSEDKSCELLKEIMSTGLCGTENDNSNSEDDFSSIVQKPSNREQSSIFSGEDILDEEEAAFLRSLGWEESGVEGGLTQKEIDDYRQKVGLPLDLSTVAESGASNVGESSE